MRVVQGDPVCTSIAAVDVPRRAGAASHYSACGAPGAVPGCVLQGRYTIPLFENLRFTNLGFH